MCNVNNEIFFRLCKFFSVIRLNFFSIFYYIFFLSRKRTKIYTHTHAHTFVRQFSLFGQFLGLKFFLASFFFIIINRLVVFRVPHFQAGDLMFLCVPRIIKLLNLLIIENCIDFMIAVITLVINNRIHSPSQSVAVISLHFFYFAHCFLVLFFEVVCISLVVCRL